MLVDAADLASAAASAIGVVPWSAEDRGRVRGASPDIGAHQR